MLLLWWMETFALQDNDDEDDEDDVDDVDNFDDDDDDGDDHIYDDDDDNDDDFQDNSTTVQYGGLVSHLANKAKSIVSLVHIILISVSYHRHISTLSSYHIT